MYHSKHKHSRDEHPHAGTHLRGMAPAGDAAEQTEEQPVHEMLHYHLHSDSGSGSTDSGADTSSAAAEDKEAADAATLLSLPARRTSYGRSACRPQRRERRLSN